MAQSKEQGPTRKVSKKAKPRKVASKGRRRSLQKDVSEALLRHLGVTAEENQALTEFRQLKHQARVKASREIIQQSIVEGNKTSDARFSLALEESESLLDGYATLDDQHRAEIKKLIKQITAYLHDSTRKRPFNALMLAAPGAGKSHFIKQLAAHMEEERVQAVTFNMATMQSADDMAQPIDELRNLKVNMCRPGQLFFSTRRLRRHAHLPISVLLDSTV